MVACISLRQSCWYCLGNKSRISLQRVISTSSRGVTLGSNIIRRFLTKGCWLKWWITIRSLLFVRYWHRTSETKQPVMSLDMLWYDTLRVALLRSVQNRYPCWKLSLFLEEHMVQRERNFGVPVQKWNLADICSWLFRERWIEFASARSQGFCIPFEQINVLRENVLRC